MPTQNHRPREPLIPTVKEMAEELERSRRYVTDMRRGGFKLPATRTEAIAFIRDKGPPTRFRCPRPSTRAPRP